MPKSNPGATSAKSSDGILSAAKTYIIGSRNTAMVAITAVTSEGEYLSAKRPAA